MGHYGDNLPAAIAEQLRAEKAAKKLSLDALAEATGISKSSVRRYLDGSRDLPMDAFGLFADAFRISPREFMQRALDRIE